MNLRAMSEIDLKGKRVLIREDLNVPLNAAGQITNDKRLQAALPTLQMALAQGASVMVLSHLGRPEEGVPDPAQSLAPVAEYLSALLSLPVRFETDWIEGLSLVPGEVVLCENTRFLVGEKANDPTLSRKMAALCDVFVMDAFGTAHRAQASTEGVARFAPIACAGPLLLSEVNALQQALSHPQAPVLAIVGGAKVSSKLTVLDALIEKVDVLIPGGGIANTFLAAQGFDLGESLVEHDLIPMAQELLTKAERHHCQVCLPQDVRVATHFSATATARICALADVQASERVLDIGPATEVAFAEAIAKARTILWNGPVGVFEFPAFQSGTQAVATAIAHNQQAFSLGGGGDTLAAIDTFAIGDQLSYISTGGGAFLEFLEGKTLPAIATLSARGMETA